MQSLWDSCRFSALCYTLGCEGWLQEFPSQDAAEACRIADRVCDSCAPQPPGGVGELLSLNKPTRASSVAGPFLSWGATDGDVDTAWLSDDGIEQWIEVDLEAPVDLSTLQIVWSSEFPALVFGRVLFYYKTSVVVYLFQLVSYILFWNMS